MYSSKVNATTGTIDSYRYENNTYISHAGNDKV